MPGRIEKAEAEMLGKRPDQKLAAACGDITRETIEFIGDLHGPADYRRALLGTMVERALIQSFSPRQDR
jgi:CO/xanthine dehydrogenase FAD-binding subunit